MKTYKIDLKSHFRHLWSYILITILLPLILYFLLLYKKGYFDLEMALWVGSISFVLYSIPVLLLHLKYYFENKNDVFEYDKNSKIITYRKKNKTIVLNLNDIQKTTVYKSRPLIEKRTGILIWDDYHYALIELKDGQVLKLSSLLVYELDKIIKFDNIEIKKTFYAWMP